MGRADRSFASLAPYVQDDCRGLVILLPLAGCSRYACTQSYGSGGGGSTSPSIRPPWPLVRIATDTACMQDNVSSKLPPPPVSFGSDATKKRKIRLLRVVLRPSLALLETLGPLAAFEKQKCHPSSLCRDSPRPCASSKQIIDPKEWIPNM